MNIHTDLPNVGINHCFLCLSLTKARIMYQLKKKILIWFVLKNSNRYHLNSAVTFLVMTNAQNHIPHRNTFTLHWCINVIRVVHLCTVFVGELVALTTIGFVFKNLV